MNGSQRIEQAIHRAGEAGRTALVSYLTAGYPDMASFRSDLAKVASVSDVVEVGVPFTD
ncbi:MAG: tryptophan synthase subunit alpha, partial [Gammaproteobacteria bacterium]